MDKLTSNMSAEQLIKIGGLAAVSFTLLALGKKYFNGGECTISKDLTGKVAIVTGGNGGIGKETCRALATMGATVIIASRDEKKSLPVVEELKKDTKNDKISFIRLDLSDLESVKTFVQTFKSQHNRLDFLINNAGIMALPTRKTTKQGFEMQLGTNHIGHFYLTTQLLDLLKASAPSRVINVSSNAQLGGKMNWDDLMAEKKYSPFGTYSLSKLANVIFSRELQKRMDNEKVDVKVFSLHPGVVRTNLGNELKDTLLMKILFPVIVPVLGPFYYYITKSASRGAHTTLYCALEDVEALKPGVYYSDCKPGKMNPEALDDSNGTKLWEVSEDLIAKKIQ